MEEKRGVQAIIYDNAGQPFFLVLHRNKNWKGWEFVKGGYTNGEAPEQAIAREVYEETGLQKFSVKHKFEQQKSFEADGKKHVFDVFLVQASMNIPINIHNNPDKEHDKYVWTTKDKVFERLQWQEDKDLFEDAYDVIMDDLR